jgi:hypothetical protein
MATRLFRSIIAFGTALGAGAGVATLVPACALYAGDDSSGDDWHGIIDAALPCADGACPDAWPPISDAFWPMIDASMPPPDAAPDAWPTIADAPSPDAATTDVADPAGGRS